MSLVNLVLKDFSKKNYETILNLRLETHNLITDNITKMINFGFDINIHLIDYKILIDDLDKAGWKKQQGLYEELIHKYQTESGNNLDRWK